MAQGGLSQPKLDQVAEIAQEAVARVMRAGGFAGDKRRCYVVIVVAEGNAAGKVFAHSPMTNVTAHAFADAVEHEADTIRENAARGLMGEARAAAVTRNLKDQG